MNTERIPEAVLIAARLRLKRRVASVILAALSETGQTLEEIDAKVQQPTGWARAFLLGLIDGTTDCMDTVSDLTVALNVEIEFSLKWPLTKEFEADAEVSP